MQEQIIEFETAKLAKKKEFGWPVVSFYDKDGNLNVPDSYDGNSPMNWNEPMFTSFSAPTQSLLQKWLREKHDIEVYVFREMSSSDDSEWNYKIRYFANPTEKREYKQYETIDSMTFYPGGYSNDTNGSSYEQALEDGLARALHLIKK